ncbi:MAG: metal-dependent transcriptional regulator [Candidatus Hodarchaeota archaeon]
MKDLNESYEDYLKAIYIISRRNKGGWVSNLEISECLNVKPPSVSDMLHKLKEKGLVNWEPRKSIRLTDKGKEIAIKMIQNYNILYKFFKQILKIKDNSLLEDLCCGIEHHMTPEISESLQGLL